MSKGHLIILPPRDELRRLFEFDADQGLLFWRYRQDRSPQWNGRFAGKVVGGPSHQHGYWVTCMTGLGPVLVHRVIWKWMFDTDPEFIDHRDGNPSNNRLCNLREASRKDNMRNKKPHRGKLLPKGVSFVTGRTDLFRATIYSNKKSVHLGCFDSADDAHAAYVNAAKKTFGQFARAS
ncbi:HNH endonuclease signature motif containing protein [Brucella pseudintermedia]|uniref:HNH endonuclease signature motif containing protein n=1 Tax=Brucella pseudintermedia TaxID=370111 RepID=UPI00366E9CAB|nr:HNH endonuclease signature motif containing protein [Brucella pseudintermedia]